MEKLLREVKQSMNRSALFVGINRYEDPNINKLEYAEKDATELYALFKRGVGYGDVRYLLSPDSDELLDTAQDMVKGLKPGDLFLMFFAGHGTESEGRHLLLCPGARHSRLKYYQHVVPLDLLVQETERSGINRVIVLDACRKDLLSGERSSKGRGMRDVKCVRDAVVQRVEGSLGILCSCDKGQQSRELPGINQGIFTMAFLKEVEEAIQEGRSLLLSDELVDRIGSDITEMGDKYSFQVTQRPWVQKSGEIPPIYSPTSDKEPKSKSTAKGESTREKFTPVAISQRLHEDSDQSNEIQTIHESPAEQIILELPGRVELIMRLIPSGSFLMGSQPEEKGRLDMEGPQHKVTITKPFYIGIYPVTQAQWKAVMGNNPSRFKEDPNNPVEQVSWEDCQSYILRMNEFNIGTFRLPTEAEWEYTCRAGSNASFSWGNDISLIEFFAWCSGHSQNCTHHVGQKEKNELGLYDMHGNVWEWCSDWFGDYSEEPQINPRGPEKGAYRVKRGGSWVNNPLSCRSANRSFEASTNKNYNLGFRLVKTAEDGK